MERINHKPIQRKWLLSLCLGLVLTTSCPEPTTPPEATECDEGYHPCGEDSTDCCRDTTSHDFVWEIDTLGGYGSYLNDVVIINENDIWVVGNIVTDSMEYNAAHWDGNEWELLGIYSNTLDLYSIQYFSENDIWVTDYCSPIHWDGEVWTLYHLQNMGLDACTGSAIWGSSPSDIYFVGVEGSIVHYDGTSFTKMESGTEVDLIDICGTPEGQHAFATGFILSGENAGQTATVEFIDNEWQTLYSYHTTWHDNNSTGGVYACYVYGDTVYFNRTGGFWKFNYITRESTIILLEDTGGLSNFGWRKVIVAEINDIHFMSTGFSYLHFNGLTWNIDSSVNVHFSSDCLSDAIAYADNMIVMVGKINLGNDRAVVVWGNRE